MATREVKGQTQALMLAPELLQIRTVIDHALTAIEDNPFVLKARRNFKDIDHGQYSDNAMLKKC